MKIDVDHLSYAYDKAAAAKAARRKGKAPSDKRQGSAAASHHWGNDPDHQWALREVTLTIEAGELLGVAGHTGSGKSTLLLALAGLLKPTSGSVLVTDDDGRQQPASDLRGRIGVVFQYPEHQLFAPTVLEDVGFGPRNLGLTEQEVHDRSLRALARVGLDPEAIADRSPFQLSGGQQRRVAVAGVLAMEPEVLAMDEPAAGLDPRGMEELLSLIQSLHAEGITILLISHSMAHLATYADRVLLLNEGRVAALGAPEEVFHHPDTLVSVGLGLPPAAQLALGLREAGLPLPEGMLTESELVSNLIPLLIGTERDR